MINVGVDATGFRPISENEIAAIIEHGVVTRDPYAIRLTCSRSATGDMTAR